MKGEGVDVTDQVDVAAVIAARSGDRGALDTLVAEYLPLVYNIVGRTLSSDADVDDVVQDTMVRVVRAIGGLREPERFRSWLVAVTVNQIRDHRRRWYAAVTRLEDYDDQPDPNAEFVDHALTRLAMARRRQEIAYAARWLHAEDRELLSLWSLERGGHLTRADVVSALRLEAHHVTVRVSRLKQRLEGARMLVRALSASPRCPQLARAASAWPGEPSPLWRKRFLRHVGVCRRCREARADMVAAERVLLGLALLPLPVGYLRHLLTDVHNAPQAAAASRQLGPLDGEAPSHAATARGFHRIVDFVAAKPVLVVAGVTAVCALGLIPVVVPHLPTGATAAAPVSASTLSTPDHGAGVPSTIATTTSTTPSTTTSPPPPTTLSAPPRTTTVPRPAPSSPPAPKTTTTAPSSPAEQVLGFINQARAEAGLPPYRMDAVLITG